MIQGKAKVMVNFHSTGKSNRRTIIKESTNALLILIILSLPLISNSIVLEPFHKAPFNENNYFHNSELESSYIIHHKNGTYTLYFNDETFELTEIDPIFKDLPIIEE